METKQPVINFALQKITTEQFAIIEDGFEDKGDIRIGINLRFAANDEFKIVSVFSAFTFVLEQKPFIIIEAGCHFNIKEESWFQMYVKEGNKLEVRKNFMTHLAMLTIGTTRGILHSKTENTCFNKYIVPTINVTELVKEDVAFEFKEV
jgi:hypothetical protein